MKIYAVRDRLIDYMMPPFIAPGDKEALASLADLVNGETKHAITQAPHHFEIWRLGEVTEEGHIHPNREFLADASGLVRNGVRGNPQARTAAAAAEAPGDEISHGRTPGSYGAHAAPNKPPIRQEVGPTPTAAPAVPG